MSESVTYGKDTIIFVSEEELSKPSTITLSEIDDEPRGVLLPNGEINWSCPCLGSMVIGPCNVEFRESLSCFHNSKADPKGSDCIDSFREFSDCMARYPALYPKDDDDDDDDHLAKLNLDEDSLEQDARTMDDSQDVKTVEESELDSETKSVSKAGT